MADQSIDTIPVADLLELVRKHADEHGWCETAEEYLVRLGLRFAYDPETCWCEDCAPSEPKRFTLADDSPTTVSRDAGLAMWREVKGEWGGRKTRDFIDEAAARFGLKVEATR